MKKVIPQFQQQRAEKRSLDHEILAEQIKDEMLSFSKKQIKNARESSFYQWKIMIFEFLICFFTTITILLCIIILQTESSFQETDLSESLKNMISFVTIIILILIIMQKLIIKTFVQSSGNQQYSFSISQVALEIFILLPHPNSYIDSIQIVQIYQDQTYYYKLNHLLTILVIFRIWYLIRFYLKYLQYYGARALRILEFYGNSTINNLGLNFVIRCFFRQFKKLSIILLFVFNLVIIAFVIMILQKATQNSRIKNFLSMIYFSTVTMATIGYGDIVVYTSMGKIMTVCLIISGLFLSSLFIINIIKALELNVQQQKVYHSTYEDIIKCQINCMKDNPQDRKSQNYQQKVSNIRI